MSCDSVELRLLRSCSRPVQKMQPCQHTYRPTHQLEAIVTFLPFSFFLSFLLQETRFSAVLANRRSFYSQKMRFPAALSVGPPRFFPLSGPPPLPSLELDAACRHGSPSQDAIDAFPSCHFTLPKMWLRHPSHNRRFTYQRHRLLSDVAWPQKVTKSNQTMQQPE